MVTPEPLLIASMPDLVGPAYIRRGLEELFTYKVHRSAVLAAQQRSEFPDPVYGTAKRLALGMTERLYYKFDVDMWLSDIAESGSFKPRPAADIPRTWGFPERPREE